jgi:hypothetical protein
MQSERAVGGKFFNDFSRARARTCGRGEADRGALARLGASIEAAGGTAPFSDSEKPVDSIRAPGRKGGSGEPAKRISESR